MIKKTNAPLVTSHSGFRVGTAVRDITPPTGYLLQGHEARKGKSEKVHDPLMLKALSVSNGQQRVYVVASDLVYFPLPFAEAIKQDACTELGLAPEQVLLTADHVHTGPFMFGVEPGDKDRYIPGYWEELRRKIIEAMREAAEKEESATLVWGQSEVNIGVVNRRLKTPYGIEMRPNPEGPIDTDALVLAALGADGKPRAILFNYACHPTTIGTDIYEISSDYPGVAQRALEARFPGATALFVNGCCGDVRPSLIANGQFRGGTFEDVDRMGKALAEAITAALAQTEPVNPGPVEGRLETLALPLDSNLIPDTPEKLEQAATKYLKQPRRDETVSGAWHTPSDEPAVAAWKKEMAARLARGEKPATTLPMDIHVLAIGDVRLAGMSGELMTEIGMKIKAAAGFRTLVASCSNGVLGYIPTAAALPEGGYEAKTFLYRKFPAPYDVSMEKVLLEKTLALIKKRV